MGRFVLTDSIDSGGTDSRAAICASEWDTDSSTPSGSAASTRSAYSSGSKYCHPSLSASQTAGRRIRL
ncbi:hypothetical protein GCM10009727_57980 [Actinomadura napierensis]|uniref:Uncharacterized protein n=1 Tax=Actinomadura napierensis TaxID=267854 RepID=A0ABP5LWE9_9ACTN